MNKEKLLLNNKLNISMYYNVSHIYHNFHLYLLQPHYFSNVLRNFLFFLLILLYNQACPLVCPLDEQNFLCHKVEVFLIYNQLLSMGKRDIDLYHYRTYLSKYSVTLAFLKLAFPICTISHIMFLNSYIFFQLLIIAYLKTKKYCFYYKNLFCHQIY